MQQIKSTYRNIISILSLLGFATMGYLTYIHFANIQSFCDISVEVSCDVVNTSIYSEVFGIPLSVLGVLFFAYAAYISFTQKTVKPYETLFFITIFSLIPSLYLSFAEIFFIHSLCILCEASKIFIIGILITSFLIIKHEKKDWLRLIIPIIIAGLVSVGIMYFNQTSSPDPRDHTPLIEHMNEQGWIYYKSYTCSSCRKQEKLLGDAYKIMNSVECHPKGPNGQAELCLKKRIEKTPTWILEPNGIEVKRLEGIQSVESLAKAAEFIINY